MFAKNWFLLEIFSRNFRQNINLALHCLVGGWEYPCNIYLFSAPLGALADEEVQKSLVGLSADSIQIALTWVCRCRNLERVKEYPLPAAATFLSIWILLKMLLCVRRRSAQS